ncbi:hypothetical protein ZOD2009_09800 [Haladaptatus paucihalophilus DX253]|uniref:Uncharacterized protein n=1 Tax=Haladaptatus paucihalophilus DX253 TaxID=797209 RepID=E7QT60_HALPU|nr:hypothetical protein ZOD2009_09800 [Haladaptatus paucihalophilus DX253]SHL60827.1 hypothetical protein SAMN05444342_4239 [Haladaptatus paucihalophilus DX253]
MARTILVSLGSCSPRLVCFLCCHVCTLIEERDIKKLQNMTSFDANQLEHLGKRRCIAENKDSGESKQLDTNEMTPLLKVDVWLTIHNGQLLCDRDVFVVVVILVILWAFNPAPYFISTAVCYFDTGLQFLFGYKIFYHFRASEKLETAIVIFRLSVPVMFHFCLLSK